MPVGVLVVARVIIVGIMKADMLKKMEMYKRGFRRLSLSGEDWMMSISAV